MRAGILFSLLLAGCDDTIFGAGSSSSTDSAGYGTGYTGVEAIFADNCTSCHSPGGGTQGGLDLETDACAALVGVQAPSTYSGMLVVPGDHASSVLWNKMAATGVDGEPMPLGGSLDSSTVDIVKNWIDDGASCGDSSAP